MTTKHDWEQLYSVAVLETDQSKMEDRIRAVEYAIKRRLNGFSLECGGTPEENQAIVDALLGLSVLRGDLATWQGFETRKLGSQMKADIAPSSSAAALCGIGARVCSA